MVTTTRPRAPKNPDHVTLLDPSAPLAPAPVEALLTVASALHGAEAVAAGEHTVRRGELFDRLANPRDASEYLRRVSRWYVAHTEAHWAPPPHAPDATALAELRAIRRAVRAIAEGSIAQYERLTRGLVARHEFRLDLLGRIRPTETGWAGFVGHLLPTLVALKKHRSRLRHCANPRCGWFLLDRSRAGTRQWCAMSLCGNRQKARRFRARRRPKGLDPTGRQD